MGPSAPCLTAQASGRARAIVIVMDRKETLRRLAEVTSVRDSFLALRPVPFGEDPPSKADGWLDKFTAAHEECLALIERLCRRPCQ
jgi:hypothetical protein